MICLPSCGLASLLEEVPCFRNEAYALVNIVRGVQINKKEQYNLYIYIYNHEKLKNNSLIDRNPVKFL